MQRQIGWLIRRLFGIVVLGFPSYLVFRFSTVPGTKKIVPARAPACLSTPPPFAELSVDVVFFAWGQRGPLCGVGVEWSWCRGGSGNARESRCPAENTPKGAALMIQNDVMIVNHY